MSRFVDSFVIEQDSALKSLAKNEEASTTDVSACDDPLALMSYACMYYGALRYTEALHSLRRAKSLFMRKDNPLYYDALCVLEVMILRVLSRVPQALEKAHQYLQVCEGASRQKLCVLCVQMYRLAGDYQEANLLLEALMAQDTSKGQHELFHLLSSLAKRDQYGDHQGFCFNVSATYWHYLAESKYDKGVRSLLSQYGAELAYSYAWQGRTDLAGSVLQKIDPTDDNESYVFSLSAQAFCHSADQKFDDALDLLIDENMRVPGISFEDAFVIHIVRLLILHFAGHKREALPLAVKLSEFAKANPTLALSNTAHLLMVSVMLWMFDFLQAQELLDHFIADRDITTLRISEQALYACLRALIAHRMHDQGAVKRSLESARTALTSPNASVLVGALCAVHPTLLGIIAHLFGVDAIPANLIEVLDHVRYRDAIAQSSGMLSQDQRVMLQKRFTRIDTGVSIIFEEQTKPIVIKLFGGLSMTIQGEPIDLSGWARSKSHQLFLRTVLEQGADLPRDTTLMLLWPDLSKKAAANNYYVTLAKMCSYLEKKCGPPPQVEIISRATCGKVHLNLLMCECDVGRFDSAAIRARKSVLERDFDVALQHYYQLVELYRGDLLVGDYDYSWLELHRERYRKRYLDSMLAASNICLDVGQPSETHFFIDAALRQEPSREAFYDISLRAYKAMGRREDALNVYYECVEYLHDELGLDPSHEFQSLFNDLINS